MGFKLGLLRASNLSAYVVLLPAERSAVPAIAEGHYVILLSPDGNLHRIGRIMRIRADLQTTNLYFDRLHSFQTSISLSDVGLSEPTGAVVRLQAEDVVRILARDGITVSLW